MPIRQAVILVGGLGTRLGEVTSTTPKPMLEVGGRPFIEHVLAHVARFGITDILLLAGYRGEAFQRSYDGRRMFGAQVTVAVEPEPLGTGGALRFVADRLAPVFLMANGDTFFDADLLALLGIGERNGPATLLLRPVDDPSRYGQVVVTPDGLVTNFKEKLTPAVLGASTLINAGSYVLHRDAVLAHIQVVPCSFEQQVLPRLLASGLLRATEGTGYFVDIGIPESLAGARKDLPRVRTRPAAFLDRDGVINVDEGYTHRIEDLRFVEDAPAAIRALNSAGHYAIVVSNQAGIARGYYGENQARLFNQHLREELMAAGARLDAIYFCPHHPEGTVPDYARVCNCRKPAPGLLEMAAQEWPIDRAGSFLIGDTPTDLAAGEAFGIPTFHHAGGSLLATVQRALGGGHRSFVLGHEGV